MELERDSLTSEMADPLSEYYVGHCPYPRYIWHARFSEIGSVPFYTRLGCHYTTGTSNVILLFDTHGYSWGRTRDHWINMPMKPASLCAVQGTYTVLHIGRPGLAMKVRKETILRVVWSSSVTTGDRLSKCFAPLLPVVDAQFPQTLSKPTAAYAHSGALHLYY
jgi:hypothetical protein